MRVLLINMQAQRVYSSDDSLPFELLWKHKRRIKQTEAKEPSREKSRWNAVCDESRTYGVGLPKTLIRLGKNGETIIAPNPRRSVATADDLVAAAIKSNVTTITLDNDMTLTAPLVINNGAKTIDLNNHILTVAGYPITITSNNSKLIGGTIPDAVIIGGAGTGFSVEDVIFTGTLVTANTAVLSNNISFLRGSVGLAITSTNPAKQFDGTALTAAIAPGTGTAFKNLTITGAVTASLAATYNTVVFTGAVTASTAVSTFTSCTFNAAVTNLNGNSDYTGSIFNGPVTNTAGNANYTNATFNNAWTLTAGNPVLTGTIDVALALTTPAVGGGNAIAVGGATKTGNVNVVNTTASVVITGTKLAGQTVVIGGADLANVLATGTATAPIYTVNTTSVAAAGGSKVFTLTVSEAGKANIVYNVTVVVATP